MLVDYISPDKLPHFIVWLDWNIHAYSKSMWLFQAAFSVHYMLWVFKWNQPLSLDTILVPIIVAFAAWNVYCALRYGYAVG